MNIVHLWGSGDDVVSWVLGASRFIDILLGHAKVPGSGFIGFVASGLLNRSRGISFVF